MQQGVGPEARRDVGVLEEAPNVFFGDAHSPFHSCRHRVCVGGCRSDGDVPCLAQRLESCARCEL
eukprot:924146-Rhodomonas_salina.1